MKYTYQESKDLNYTVDTSTGSLTASKIMQTGEHRERTFDRAEMKQFVNAYKGANRIDKPLMILFYTDCMNGSSKNWIQAPKYRLVPKYFDANTGNYEIMYLPLESDRDKCNIVSMEKQRPDGTWAVVKDFFTEAILSQ